MIDFRVLGPLVVIAGGRPVSLGPKQRILLLALLLAAGRPVSSARLADLLWEGAASVRSAATLRSHIAHLRRALQAPPGYERGPGEPVSPLVTGQLGAGAAYSLHIDREQIDSAQFERFVADGRVQMTAGLVREAQRSFASALALWRGPALADVADMSFAVSEVRRLEALHRAAWSSRLEADVLLGGHREVIGELEAMLARWPDDEGLRRLLVLCLYRAGCAADAARVCREGIALALDHGLDITTMNKLQRDLLERAIPDLGVRWPERFLA